MANDSQSLSELVSSGLAQASRLFRDEVQLARAEISANVTHAAMPLGILLLGACVLIASLVLLLGAFAAWLLQHGMSDAASKLIAACVGIGGSIALAWYGVNQLRASELMPEKAVHQVRKDVAAVKEHL